MRKVFASFLLIVAFAGFAFAAGPDKVTQEQKAVPVKPGVSSPAINVDSTYQIGVGDVLGISVWKDEALTRDVTVLPDGMISFPLLGLLKAGGKTVGQFKAELEERLKKYVNDPVLDLKVRQVNSLFVYVIGKVNKPDRLVLNGNVSVLQALSMAGGLNTFAKRNSVKVIRSEGGTTKTFPFQYDDVVEGKHLEQNMSSSGVTSLLCRKAVRRLLPLFLAPLLAPLLSPAAAGAADFQLIPNISEELRYNDNVFVTSTNKIHDFISYTLGGLQLLDKTERLDLNMSAQGAQSFYKDHPGYDSTDLLSNGTAGYKLTDKLTLSGRAAFGRDSQPDDELLTTGLIYTTALREHYTYGATAAYSITEKTSASLSSDEGTYHTFNTPALKFFDTTWNSTGLAFQHDLSQFVSNTKGLLNLVYGDYSTTQGIDVYSYEATTGVSYAFQEKWSVQVAAGAQRTETDFSTPGLVQRTEYGWGGVGSASLKYQGEATSASFSASRDIAPAYGLSGPLERTSFAFSASRQFTYEISGVFSTGYFINKSSSSQFTATSIDIETLNVSPGVRYSLNKDMYLLASYTYTRYQDKVGGITADRNLFLVRFFVQHAVLE